MIYTFLMSQTDFGRYSDEFKDYWKQSGRKIHGGTYAKGKRKTSRPFDSRKPMHVVMRSSKAIGTQSFRNFENQPLVDKIIRTYAMKFGVQIYKFSINGNHLHILIRAKRKEHFKSFLRTTAGLIARKITGAKKGVSKGKFWDTLTFTRIAEWGKAFENLRRYVVQNILEAAGVIPYQPRKRKILTGSS